MSTPSAPHADDGRRPPQASSPGFPAARSRSAHAVPGDAEIRELHRRLAPTPQAFALVHTHCVVVAAVAAQLLAARPQRLDPALVHAGCLLHDVGVYRLYDGQGRLDRPNYLRHGLLGEQLLAELGHSAVLTRFCSHHTGVGLTREDVVRDHLPLPVADYLAETAEEQLVMYADTFHSKSDPPAFVAPRAARAQLARFGAEKAARFDDLAARFGLPDLEPLAATFGHAVREV